MLAAFWHTASARRQPSGFSYTTAAPISTSSASGAVEAAAFGTVVSGAEFDLIGGGLVGSDAGALSRSSRPPAP